MNANTNASHTPGPWEAHGVDVIAGNETRRGMHGWRVVAAAAGRPSDPETIANVSLLTAAPDMLEALRDGLEQMRQMCGMFDDEDHTIGAAMSLMEAAIAKATGGKG